jgi:hypothetical protein
MLPKYRLAVEKLAGKSGLLKIVCRYRHARRRREHPDPHRALHASCANTTATRREILDGARLPPDRGARGPKGLRHAVVTSSCQAPEHVVENKIAHAGESRR